MSLDDHPLDYRDPTYAALDASVEKRLDLPPGLLASIRVNGERSNADQVSEAGAKTSYQIVPATRRAAIDKYGIDPYLSAQNAAEVAGRLLKDSLDRNKGDVSAAVAEYHGGTDRSNWGPRTRAYQGRVLKGLPADAPPDQPQQGASTFDRAMSATAPDTSHSIANVYAAYQSGQMTPEDAKTFEDAVNGGKMLLPRGATLKPGAADAPQTGQQVPQGVLDAYTSNQMTAEDRAQFEKLVQAGQIAIPHGADPSLSQLQLRGRQAAAYPDRNYDPTVIPNGQQFQRDEKGVPYLPRQAQAPEPGIGDKIVGGLEAGAAVATGLVGGMLAPIDQFVVEGGHRLIGDSPQASVAAANAARDADINALVYQPRTEVGQQYAGTLGETVQRIGEPLMGLGPEMAAMHGAGQGAGTQVAQGARAAPTAVADTIGRAQGAVKTAAGAVMQRARSVVGLGDSEAAAATGTAGTMGSVGSAGVDLADVRTQTAQSLPVPMDLTKGMASRDFEQLRFEGETAKDPTHGEPLRERHAILNRQADQNFDAFIDQTGAAKTSQYDVGDTVDSAIREQAQRDKNRVNVAYANAKAAGAMEAPVPYQSILDYIQEQTPTTVNTLAPVLRSVAEQIARNDPAGSGTISINALEDVRKMINRDAQPGTPNMVHGIEMKRRIDQATDGQGGDLYQKARALRTEYAKRYEDHKIVSDLLDTKPGTSDRTVALEDVFKRAILNSKQDEMHILRRRLQQAGPQGWQAWRELQGATLRHIQETTTSGSGLDVHGNRIVSPAKLDRVMRQLDPKLDYVFGKRTANSLRDLNEIVKLVKTSPAGSVNHSNTASVLMQALMDKKTWIGGGFEAALTASLTGLPVPALTMIRTGLKTAAQTAETRRLQARINDALGRAQSASRRNAPGSRTVH